MSYQYQKKSSEELESLGARILEKVAHRRTGCFVDIEGIIEDFGITIIPRRGQLHEFAYGYAPKDPRYIVLAEAQSSYPPQYRAIAAEEFCHIVLEYDLYDPEKRPPEGSFGHQLTNQQRWDIEHDARFLAGAILFPKIDFLSRFQDFKEKFSSVGGDPDKTLRQIVSLTAEPFKINDYLAGRRAMHLELITPPEFKKNYPDRLLF